MHNRRDVGLTSSTQSHKDTYGRDEPSLSLQMRCVSFRARVHEAGRDTG